MDKVKVNDFVTAYANALDLTDNQRKTIAELMENIIQKYEKIIPGIPVSMDSSNVYIIKPVNGQYSVEDFFLNRLMRNIWTITNITQKSVDEGFSGIHTKGQFDPSLQELSINIPKTAKQLEAYKTVLGENYDKMRKKANKKVIMHEFEHGLQTVYTNELDMRYRQVYKRISDELKKMPKYAHMIRTYEEIPKKLGDYNKYISTGCHYSSHAEKSGIKNYRHVKGSENLNEILNETESLEMASQESYLSRIFEESGNSFSIRNPESSNCEITNYGELFKQLLGGKATFVLMYLNPSKGFENFNSAYSDIFQEAYGSDKDAIEIFITAITSIKKTKSEDEHLKLTATLTKCLEKKINKHMDNSNVTNQQMLNSISCFERFSITNSDPNKRNNLDHVKKLNELRKKVSSRTLGEQKKAKEQSKEIPPIPTFDEVKQFASRYELTTDTNNNRSSIKIIDSESGQVINDPNIVPLALFSNIWLMSAGNKWTSGETKRGEEYAFNDGSKRVYDFFVDSMISNLEETGNISTIDIFKNAEFLSYKHSQEIIANLFRSEYQTCFLDDFFRKRCENVGAKTSNPQPLYGFINAGQIAYGSNLPNHITTQGSKK